MDLGVKKEGKIQSTSLYLFNGYQVRYSMIARTMLMVELAMLSTSAITDMETFVDFFFSLPFGTICTFRWAMFWLPYSKWYVFFRWAILWLSHSLLVVWVNRTLTWRIRIPHFKVWLPYNQLSSIIEYTIIGWPHSQNPSKITGRPCSNTWYQSNAICRKPLRAWKWPRSSGDRRCSSIGHAMWKVILFRDWATWQRSISVENMEMSVQRLSCNSLQWQ